ncbi:MAG: cytochrome c oxidase subunit I [Dehalococcoidia bacterium]|nr:cytochrome c oxidase subunit I [Dehalococcoidia bacterium]
MATTAAAPPVQAPEHIEAPPASVPGWMKWLTTVDHKRIGILYTVTGVLFFFVGGIEALFLRTQLALPANNLINGDWFNQLLTMHGTTMVFMAVMPINVGLGNYIIPIMLGAHDMAYPRLNAMSYWLFLFGSLLMTGSFVSGGAPDTGWFGYAPLTESQYATTHGVDFWILGLLVLGIGSMAGAFNFIVTIVKLRAPGMTFSRMPMFVWMTLITSFLLIFAFPSITAALILLLFDRYLGTHFYMVEQGGDPLLWQHLFWFFGHPEVYILILPPMGIISDILPTFSRKPLFGYPVVVYSGLAIGFLGFSVWAHHMFAVGMGPVANAAFATTSMFIAVPTGVKIFNWIATMWGGSLRLNSAMLFAVGFVAMFIIGGISGISLASPPLDFQATDTYFVVAHFHYVLFGGSIFGIFAGIYYWYPKMTGRVLSEALGKWQFWIMMIGFNITFFPQHYLGLAGMPRRIYTYASGLGFDDWNLVSSIGAYILAGSFLIFIWNVIVSASRSRAAPADPWGGHSLEWAASSPPAEHNFVVVPTVQSRHPMWDQPGLTALVAGRSAGGELPAPDGADGDGHGNGQGNGEPEAHGELVETGEHAVEEHHGAELNLPGPTAFPLILALGVALMGAGLIYHILLSFVGLVFLLVGLSGFVWRTTQD